MFDELKSKKAPESEETKDLSRWVYQTSRPQVRVNTPCTEYAFPCLLFSRRGDVHQLRRPGDTLQFEGDDLIYRLRCHALLIQTTIIG
mmetsp:Transcript_9402/g.19461  ORF Transcript_9402/g.19461 Transcript_9402/m.19461 type:complete len:88 (-) Transcript_9402:44-307(-)